MIGKSAYRGLISTMSRTHPVLLLLDTYPSLAAWSFRLLANSYTGNCCRIRRSSDDAELNIGFVSGVVDTAAIDAHCAATNGYVTTWYDQMGSNNAVRSVKTDQPLICTSGVTEVSAYNGLPAMKFATSDFFNLTTGIATTQLYYHSFVFDRASAINSNGIAYQGGQSPRPFLWYLSNTTYSVMGSINVHDASQTQTGDFLVTSLRDSSDNNKMWINGTAKTTKIYANVAQTLDSIAGYYGHGGYMQEVIYFNSDQESNRSGIETDTNTYYSIW